MKKIPIYILIAIVLMGLASPLSPARAQTPAPQADTSYHLLEPLPCAIGTPNCENGTLTDFNPDAEKDVHAFTTYLNFIIRLFIGLCAVLAVVMIVIGGVEYATSELVASKEAGKERIRGAIFGLVLALGAYTLLFQINPDLLNGDVKISGVTLNVELKNFIIEEESYSGAVPTDPGGLPSGRMAGCGSPMVRIRSNINACGDIAQNLQQMIDDAKKDAGLTITGGGFRTKEAQFALRTRYCGAGNEYNRGAHCSRAVALPGQSRHQSGLAFDLNCNGIIIPETGPAKANNACFMWLRANASRYGFYNLPAEGWHWSVDGK